MMKPFTIALCPALAPAEALPVTPAGSAKDGKNRLNPLTGKIMPRGRWASVNEMAASQEQAVKTVEQAVSGMAPTSVKLFRRGK